MFYDRFDVIDVEHFYYIFSSIVSILQWQSNVKYLLSMLARASNSNSLLWLQITMAILVRGEIARRATKRLV